MKTLLLALTFVMSLSALALPPQAILVLREGNSMGMYVRTSVRYHHNRFWLDATFEESFCDRAPRDPRGPMPRPCLKYSRTAELPFLRKSGERVIFADRRGVEVRCGKVLNGDIFGQRFVKLGENCSVQDRYNRGLTDIFFVVRQ